MVAYPQGENVMGRVLLHRAAVALIMLGVLAPVLPLLVWALSGRWLFPALWPTAWSGRAWAYVVAPQSKVLTALGNSLSIALTVTLLSLFIGLPAGRALSVAGWRGRSLVTFLFLAPTIVPVFAAVMGIQVILIRLGLADTWAGVVLAHLIPVLPYMTLLLAGVFANYNADYEAQARSLGARAWQVWAQVTLPLIAPSVLTSSLFAFLISWSQYLLTLLVGGGQVVTLPVLLYAFAQSGDLPLTAALSLVFIAPALALIAFTARALSSQAALAGMGKL